MITRFICIIFAVCLLLPPAAFAGEDGLYLKDVTVRRLQNLYDKYGYQSYLFVKKGRVPPIFLQKFPRDFDKIKDNDVRNRMFIKILTPLALKVNSAILKERQELLQINQDLKKNRELSDSQTKRLEELAVKYDAFTRLKGYRRHQLQIQMLRTRIAPVPVSFLIAVSAMETNWGSSRIVKEGNSLYKELSWYTDEGLKPQGETEDDSYRIRTFPSLYDSMASYALHFNSSVDFDHTRYLRSLKLADGADLSGQELAHSMLFQSPLKNYVGILKYTITFYRLMYLDITKLADKILPAENTQH